MPVLGQENEWTYICVLGVSILRFYYFTIGFCNFYYNKRERIPKGQSKMDTNNLGYTRRGKTKEKHNTTLSTFTTLTLIDNNCCKLYHMKL